MQEFICLKDNVFFNKKIYNKFDVIKVEDELAKKISPVLFQDKEAWEKEQEVEIKEIKTAQGQGKTVETIVKEKNAEIAELKKRHKAELAKQAKEYEAKIEELELQLNPKTVMDKK